MNLDIIMAQLAAAVRANPDDVVMAPMYPDGSGLCVARLCWVDAIYHPLNKTDTYIVRVKYRSYPAEVLAVDKAPDAGLFDFTF